MIELPKDADGREIPLDTVALYDDSGNVHSIRRFIYTNDFDLNDKWINSWIAVADDYKVAKPEQMHLTKPDSWEKLEEDLDRCVAKGGIRDHLRAPRDKGEIPLAGKAGTIISLNRKEPNK